MKTILVPIDSNKEGDLVANKAIEIAEAFESKVHLVHVTSVDKNKKDNDFEIEYISTDNLSKFEKEMDILNSFKSRFTNAGLLCEVHLLRGKAYTQILKLADKIHADLIILGLINHSALYKVFIGSVSNEVIKGTKTPILLVPPKK
ncbi:MAG: universal stress protein [Weeksellaceae bacterium]|jgi:nucleotide-binding universal stress UspA family protein|nr:universal stress protein [Weeksellaceae bacterium]